MIKLLDLWNSLVYPLLAKLGVPAGEKTNVVAGISAIIGLYLVVFVPEQAALGGTLIAMSGLGAGIRGSIKNIDNALPKEPEPPK